VTSLVISLLLMFAVVGLSVRWAAREERRRNPREEGHAGHHR
jgi:putative effector of murein hydrolase LrgA (UPF0299 family)